MSYPLKFADIGEGIHEAEIIKWYINVGDIIEEDQLVLEVQTDKATVEITSPKAGKVVYRSGNEGELLYVGDTIIDIENNNESNILEPTSKIKEQNDALKSISKTINRVIAAPSVRKFARSLGVNLSDVKGSKENGRITKQDVQEYFSEANKNPKHNDEKNPVLNEDARIPIKGLRKQIYKNMEKSAFTIPHTTAMDEFQVDALIHFRKTLDTITDVKLTYMPIIIKFITEVLKKNPIFNALLDEENKEVILKKQYNIGFAVSTNEGIIVPVIHQADQKSIEEIANEMIDLQEKARSGSITLKEISGGTFTISSTGRQGGTFATPMISCPQVAILGIHAMKEKPVILQTREIGIGTIMGISLSFDHRIIDGEPVGKFIKDLKDYIEKPESLLLHTR